MLMDFFAVQQQKQEPIVTVRALRASFRREWLDVTSLAGLSENKALVFLRCIGKERERESSAAADVVTRREKT